MFDRLLVDFECKKTILDFLIATKFERELPFDFDTPKSKFSVDLWACLVYFGSMFDRLLVDFECKKQF